MKKEYKVLFPKVPKSVRKFLCTMPRDRAVMDYDVKRPAFVMLGGKQVRYEGS